MGEWKPTNIGGVTTLVTKGTTPPKGKGFVDVGVNYIKSDSLNYDGRIDTSLFVAIDEQTHNTFKRSQIKAGDILFSMAGAFLGKSGIATASMLPANTNQAVAIIRPDPSIVDSTYLGLFFRQKSIIDFVNNLSGQSAQPNINFEEIKSLELMLPELPEQRAIASVLSSLDAKIDLLHRQNKTLEGMAEALFRQWFVEEAEQGWKEKRLDEFSSVGIGRTPPRKEQHWFSTDSNDVKWISIKDMAAEGPFIFNTAEYLTEEAVERFRVPVIPSDTVVLSFKMTLGRVKITTEAMLSNEAIAHFRINDDSYVTKEFLYLGLKTYQYEILGSTSTIVDSINSGMIKSMVLRIPPKPHMSRFMEQTGPWFQRIRSNQAQIHTLTALRDTLLPKLMSGEVRVEVVQHQLQ